MKGGRIRVKCKHCGYEWNSKSTLLLVTCPSCGKKTPRVEAKD
jgi:Zn finger protein HypA/HybF involved in hydrogenase expression